MNLYDLVSQDVTLTLRNGEAWGCCPFHQEKTPSFSVNLDKQLYYCFGCDARGDAITYLMQKRGRSFIEAKRITEGENPHLFPARKTSQQVALERARAEYAAWEARTLDALTAAYWQAWDRQETVELQMALALVQQSEATAAEWDEWQRAFDRCQQECARALDGMNFFQHPATSAERVTWWESEIR